MAYNQGLYNNYGMYGNNYGQQYQPPMQQMPQQSYAPAQPNRGMDWVDGEAEAKGKPMPAGATQYAMWDINEPVIYVKSMNAMGMPNPMRKIHYKMDEMQQNPMQSGTANLMSGEEVKADMTEYVRKDELAKIKDELMQSIREIGNIPATAKRTAKEV